MTSIAVFTVGLLSVTVSGWQGAPGWLEQHQDRSSIRGKVAEAGTQKPVQGATVALVGTAMKASTDAEGEFSIPEVPSGTYTAAVSRSGYATVRWENVHVDGDRDVYMMFTLSSVRTGREDEPGEGKGLPIKPGDSDYTADAEQGPEPVGGLVALMNRVPYPEIALKGGIQGTVYVEAFINEEGTVDKVEVLKGVHELLDTAAVEAVKATRFTPGREGEKAVKTRVAIPIRFRISP